MSLDYVKDPQFGQIINYQTLSDGMWDVIDNVYPNFNLLGSMEMATKKFNNDPSYMTACAASGLAYMMLVAAEEFELAAELKGKVFTLGWTEEHSGTDLLSVKTKATPMSDNPDEKNFHISGKKWLINNSYHADYHTVIAKVDPEQNGPRSISVFVVPHSSTTNWERLDTHVLDKMVLTKFDIDGPGILLGKVGHGLSILQRMALPSKYQCSYMGMAMVEEAIPAAIKHLSTKHIFGDNPINFSNVFRQLYNLVQQAALINFTFYRALSWSDSPFLQFHGLMLKSWLLLKSNEILSQNLLIAGSKGFLRESIIGRNTIDSFVYPVFDGHYTLNTLLTYKHAKKYLGATEKVDMKARVDFVRDNIYIAKPGKQILNDSREMRNPPYFDYVDYVSQFDVPFQLDANCLLNPVNRILEQVDENQWTNEPEYRYKIGMIIHNLEAFLSACELWKATYNDNYLNGIVIQYNTTAKLLNQIISEGALNIDFIKPLRQVPLPEVDNPTEFLYGLLDVRGQIRK